MKDNLTAEQSYKIRRRGMPQLTPVYLTEEQKKQTDAVFKAFKGNKKQAILYGLELLGKELGL